MLKYLKINISFQKICVVISYEKPIWDLKKSNGIGGYEGTVIIQFQRILTLHTSCLYLKRYSNACFVFNECVINKVIF